MSQQFSELEDTIRRLNEGMQYVKKAFESGINPNVIRVKPRCTRKYGNALFLAIGENMCEEIIEYLINMGYDVNYEDQDYSFTPLLIAIKNDSLDVVKKLVAKGADINKIVTDKDTALSFSIRNDNTSMPITEYLLANGAEVNLVSYEGKTPLTSAIEQKASDIVKLLMSYGADPNKPNSDGTTPLLIAQKEGNKDILNYLTNTTSVKTTGAVKETKANTTTLNEVYLNRSLTEAVISGDLKTAHQCIQNGAKVCKLLPNGKTNLILAVQQRNTEMVKLLLDHGADHIIQTAFLEAISLEDLAVVELFIEKGAQINVTYKARYTPLTLSVELENLDIIQKLVENGANVNMADTNNNLPLTLALISGNFHIIKYLVDKNAKLPPTTLHNFPLLLKYIEENKMKIVQILVDMGVQLDTVFEFTPLTKAVQEGNLEMVEFLLKKGVDVNLANKNGTTPLAIAASNRDLPIFKFLIGAKADPDLAKKEIEKFASCSDDFAIYWDVLKGTHDGNDETDSLFDGGHEADK